MLEPIIKTFHTILFHIHTLHLFTRSDLKIFITPSTIFALSHLYLLTNHDHLAVLSRLPSILMYLYLAVLPLDINNQRLPAAIAEDTLNKPWRPLPRQRLTPGAAKQLVYIFYTLHISYSFIAGGLMQALLLIILGTWYNTYSGGERSPVIRHFINAAGFLCFLSGALQVAAVNTSQTDVDLRKWYGIIFGIIFSTIQIQDLRDQACDEASGKRTLPLVIGDAATSWSLALLVPIWTIVVSRFWNARGAGCWVGFVLAVVLAGHTIICRSQKDDKKSLLVWNVWLCWMFVMPLFGSGQLE